MSDERSKIWHPASRYEGIVPFASSSDPNAPQWMIGQGDPTDTPGKVILTVVEVVPSLTAGRLAVYFRDFIDPDGHTVNRRRRRIGSLASVRGYITKRALKPTESAS